ncbi:MAG: MarR family winged helix-turn-helix transcriptional regulator [Candidatus Devosia phytovorans]|uniref:MarR family winged helix-turn-helix transcriptional regulator n=1 Tax=Candidatus Devosia phytovorans TaxID=3121372 RepID=A0AAJ5VUK0_9HYPH|nr:MarR family winged helix-turn-helix transcriptional regulator [Devosia sp.]WEK05128.1 MAG: MarR family winged helix-turn-helix transcriptional regulator [Devosia sp.]
MARPVPPDVDSVEPYSPLNCTHTAMRQASRQLTQVYDNAIAPAGLTSAQAMLVTRLDELGGAPGGTGPSLQALAKRLSIQISALTHALRPLVRDGVVEVHPDAKDGRIKRAVLTEQGMKQTRQMYELWQGVNARVDDVLGSGKGAELRELAKKVASPEFLNAMGRSATD